MPLNIIESAELTDEALELEDETLELGNERLAKEDAAFELNELETSTPEAELEKV